MEEFEKYKRIFKTEENFKIYSFGLDFLIFHWQ